MDRVKPYKKVGTHHGRFHADGVMATAILMEIYDIEVVRTRNPEIIKDLEIVYDVGGGQYDHHDIEKVYRGDGTPYAACGLIWRAFGRDVVSSKYPSLTGAEIDSVFKYVDDVLVKGIDAADNGLRACGEVIVNTLNITSMISAFNPPWDSDESEDKAFHRAVQFASQILNNTLEQKLATMRARDIIVRAYQNRPMTQVMVLEVSCPWAHALREIDEKGEVLYVVHPNKEGYVINTVRKNGGTLEAKKDLPRSWAGKRDEELRRIVGIDDAVFCHPDRFIAGARSYESIMKMAEIAVGQEEGRANKGSKLTNFFICLKKLISRK